MFVVELIAALLVGFVLGRIWEIRQRIALPGRTDERPRRAQSVVAVRPPASPPKDENELVASFDREMKELVASIAAKGRHLSPAAQPRR
jgi:hypothetical protein